MSFPYLINLQQGQNDQCQTFSANSSQIQPQSTFQTPYYSLPMVQSSALPQHFLVTGNNTPIVPSLSQIQGLQSLNGSSSLLLNSQFQDLLMANSSIFFMNPQADISQNRSQNLQIPFQQQNLNASSFLFGLPMQQNQALSQQIQITQKPNLDYSQFQNAQQLVQQIQFAQQGQQLFQNAQSLGIQVQQPLGISSVNVQEFGRMDQPIQIHQQQMTNNQFTQQSNSAHFSSSPTLIYTQNTKSVNKDEQQKSSEFNQNGSSCNKQLQSNYKLIYDSINNKEGTVLVSQPNQDDLSKNNQQDIRTKENTSSRRNTTKIGEEEDEETYGQSKGKQKRLTREKENTLTSIDSGRKQLKENRKFQTKVKKQKQNLLDSSNNSEELSSPTSKSSSYINSFKLLNSPLPKEKVEETSLEEAKNTMKEFWKNHEDSVYKYIDQCLNSSQYVGNSEFQKSISLFHLNNFSNTRQYTKKLGSQFSPQNQADNLSQENQNERSKQTINSSHLIHYKNEETSINSSDISAKHSQILLNKTPQEGSSTQIIQNKSSNLSLVKSSRFQNLTKLLMYKIFKIFGNQDLSFLKIEQNIIQLLSKIIKKLKNLTRDKNKQSDFINHSHYRAIFLHLTKNSLEQIMKKSDAKKDISNHQALFSVDLENCDELDMSYCNISKHIIAKIFELYCQQEFFDTQPSPAFDVNRFQYLQFAKKGIQLMQSGKVIHSFDQKQQKREVLEMNSNTILETIKIQAE